MFDGVIFDMDGTLVDSEVIWERAEQEMFERRGITYTDEVRQQVIGLRLDEFFAKLIAVYGLTDSVEALSTELREAIIGYIHLIEPKQGAQALLEHVAEQQIPYAIASSSPMSVIRAVVAAQGWNELIPHLYTAGDVAHGKPAPDVYLYACEQLGLDPTRCLALEDSPNGARSAVAAGMICAVVPDFHSQPQQFASVTPYVYASLHEVLDALKTGTLDYV